MLKAQYNIEVTHALYLVDRFQDRQNLPDEKQHLASPIFDNVEIKALYDLQQVDQLIPKSDILKKPTPCGVASALVP